MTPDPRAVDVAVECVYQLKIPPFKLSKLLKQLSHDTCDTAPVVILGPSKCILGCMHLQWVLFYRPWALVGGPDIFGGPGALLKLVTLGNPCLFLRREPNFGGSKIVGEWPSDVAASTKVAQLKDKKQMNPLMEPKEESQVRRGAKNGERGN